MKSNGEVLWNKSCYMLLKYLSGEKINKVIVSDVSAKEWENGNGKDIIIELSNGETYGWQMFWNGFKKKP